MTVTYIRQCLRSIITPSYVSLALKKWHKKKTCLVSEDYVTGRARWLITSLNGHLVCLVQLPGPVRIFELHTMDSFRIGSYWNAVVFILSYPTCRQRGYFVCFYTIPIISVQPGTEEKDNCTGKYFVTQNIRNIHTSNYAKLSLQIFKYISVFRANFLHLEPARIAQLVARPLQGERSEINPGWGSHLRLKIRKFSLPRLVVSIQRMYVGWFGVKQSYFVRREISLTPSIMCQICWIVGACIRLITYASCWNHCPAYITLNCNPIMRYCDT